MHVLKLTLGIVIITLLGVLTIIQPAIVIFLDPISGPWSSLAIAKHFSGEFKLRNLKSSVKVIYDEWDVPHIYASYEEDALRVLGFLQAYDRLFQIDLARRLASGMLSDFSVFKPMKLMCFIEL